MITSSHSLWTGLCSILMVTELVTTGCVQYRPPDAKTRLPIADMRSVAGGWEGMVRSIPAMEEQDTIRS
jgi:hypothetical protein